MEKSDRLKENEKQPFALKTIFPQKAFSLMNQVAPSKPFSSSSSTRENGINGVNENGRNDVNNENSNSKDVDMLQSKLEFIQIDGQLIKKKIQGILTGSAPVRKISTPVWDGENNNHENQHSHQNNNQNNYYALPPTQGTYVRAMIFCFSLTVFSLLSLVV